MKKEYKKVFQDDAHRSHSITGPALNAIVSILDDQMPHARKARVGRNERSEQYSKHPVDQRISDQRATRRFQLIERSRIDDERIDVCERRRLERFPYKNEERCDSWIADDQHHAHRCNDVRGWPKCGIFATQPRCVEIRSLIECAAQCGVAPRFDAVHWSAEKEIGANEQRTDNPKRRHDEQRYIVVWKNQRHSINKQLFIVTVRLRVA